MKIKIFMHKSHDMPEDIEEEINDWIAEVEAQSMDTSFSKVNIAIGADGTIIHSIFYRAD